MAVWQITLLVYGAVKHTNKMRKVRTEASIFQLQAVQELYRYSWYTPSTSFTHLHHIPSSPPLLTLPQTREESIK
jgi:hypothetical protein